MKLETRNRYHYRPWTTDEEKKLRELWLKGMTVRTIANTMNRSFYSVDHRRRMLKLWYSDWDKSCAR